MDASERFLRFAAECELMAKFTPGRENPKLPRKEHNAEKREGVKKVNKWLTKSLKCKMLLGLEFAV